MAEDDDLYEVYLEQAEMLIARGYISGISSSELAKKLRQNRDTNLKHAKQMFDSDGISIKPPVDALQDGTYRE